MEALSYLSSFAAVLTLVLATSPTALASAEPVPLELVSRGMHRIHYPIDLSPDGRWLAFAESTDEKTSQRYRYYSASGVPGTWGTTTRVRVVNTTSGAKVVLGSAGHWAWAPVWSPDGRHLAYFSDETGEARLWVWEAATGRARRIGEAIVRTNSRAERVQWLSDSRRLVCRVLRESMSLSTANALSESTMPSAADLLRFRKVSADAPSVIVLTSGGEKPGGQPPSALEEDARDATTSELAVVDIRAGAATRIAVPGEPLWYSVSPDKRKLAIAAGSKRIPGGRVRRYGWFGRHSNIIYDVRSGSRRKLFEGVGTSMRGCSWSPDGTRLACFESALEDNDAFMPALRITVTTIKTGTVTTVATRIQGAAYRQDAPLWDERGETLFVAGTDEKAPNTEDSYWDTYDRLWEIDVRSGRSRVLADLPGRQVVGILSRNRRTPWHLAGKSSLWITTRARGPNSFGDNVDLREHNLRTGKTSSPVAAGAESGMDASDASSEIAYVHSDLQKPQEVWLVDATTHHARQVTQVNPDWNQYLLGESRLLEYRDASGRNLRGALLLPPDGSFSKKPYPLVVFAFGWPNDSLHVDTFGLFGDTPSYNMHALATRGYAVLMPDIVLRTGLQMKDVQSSIIAGVDAAVEQGYADPNRMAVIGYSIGSYTALALLVQTDRFKAATIGGITMWPDLFSRYLGTEARSGDTRAYDRQQPTLAMGGDPWKYRDRYVNNSPAVFFDSLNTPLLLAQGTDDGLLTADVIFGALKRLGKNVEYRIYENEDHGISSYANTLDFWRRRIDFLDEHLGIRRDAVGRIVGER